MAKEDNKAEKVISPTKLKQLVKSSQAMSKSIAEERGAYGDKFKKAVDDDGLEPKSFRMVLPLVKMDAAKASRVIRHFMRYVEILEIGGQMDLVDEITRRQEAEAAAAEPETAWAKVDGVWMEGVLIEARDDGTADVRLHSGAVANCEDGGWTVNDPFKTTESNIIQHLAAKNEDDHDRNKLRNLREALDGAETGEAVNAGVEKFVTDYPRLKDQALQLGRDRIAKIDASATTSGTDDGEGEGEGGEAGNGEMPPSAPPAAASNVTPLPKRSPGEARKGRRFSKATLAKGASAKEAADRAEKRSDDEKRRQRYGGDDDAPPPGTPIQ